jgi:hypothetical protein
MSIIIGIEFSIFLVITVTIVNIFARAVSRRNIDFLDFIFCIIGATAATALFEFLLSRGVS